MIWVKEKNIMIKDPDLMSDLHPSLKNIIHTDIVKGDCLIKIPEHIRENMDKSDSLAYKTGFLYESIVTLYPEERKSRVQEIISEQYHFFNTYRQFKNLLDLYFKMREHYYV